MHARKPKDLAERLVRYAGAIEHEPEAHAGNWTERFINDATGEGAKLHVDLGCGKGAFAVAQAAEHPDHLYIGIDYEELCIAFAAQKAAESGLGNVRIVHACADDLPWMFAPGEIDVLHLNFPTPHPRKKHAAERLTYVDRLVLYRALLSPNGHIEFKTDSQPFFDFSLTQFELAAYDVPWMSRDLHEENAHAAASEYELRLMDKGAKIHALRAVAAERPVSTEQTAALSLMDYLPEDLESLDYVPYGMERAVVNFANRRRKERAHQ